MAGCARYPFSRHGWVCARPLAWLPARGAPGASGRAEEKRLERVDRLVVQVQAAPEDDEDELAGLARRLRALLLDLDVDSVVSLAADENAEGTKGLEALLGGLVVQFGTVDGLRSVLAAVAAWAARTEHGVEVSYGEDRLAVKGVTSAQQEQLIDDFIARHAPGT
jgi:hypothetical protein